MQLNIQKFPHEELFEKGTWFVSDYNTTYHVVIITNTLFTCGL